MSNKILSILLGLVIATLLFDLSFAGTRTSSRGNRGNKAIPRRDGVTFGTFNTELVPIQETGGNTMTKLNERADAIIQLVC